MIGKDKGFLLPALLGLGIYAQNSELNLANNTTILLILFLLLKEERCEHEHHHPSYPVYPELYRARGVTTYPPLYPGYPTYPVYPSYPSYTCYPTCPTNICCDPCRDGRHNRHDHRHDSCHDGCRDHHRGDRGCREIRHDIHKIERQLDRVERCACSGI